MDCDFCGLPIIGFPVDFKAHDCVMLKIEAPQNVLYVRSEGSWCSCSFCAPFVVAQDWDGLAEHCITHGVSTFQGIADRMGKNELIDFMKAQWLILVSHLKSETKQ
jgi:hypothetical protein